jgi:hypothetical protein
LLRSNPVFQTRRTGPEGWYLHDAKSNEAAGEIPSELLEEFREHHLEPVHMFKIHQNWVDGPDYVMYAVTVHFVLGNRLSMEVEGPDRLTVDGVEASFERIAEQVLAVAEHAPAQSVTPATAESSLGWFRGIWRDHAVPTAFTIGGTVVAAGIVYYLNWT